MLVRASHSLGAKAAMQDASVVFRGTVIKSEMLPQHPEMRGEEPYATMVYVAVDTGLRVSEVIGLRWSDIHEQSITIDERLLQGRLGRAEERYLQYDQSGQPESYGPDSMFTGVDCGGEGCGRAIRCYRAVKSDGPDDMVFQSVKSGYPMRDNNILARHIKPAGRKLGIGWVNWLVLRRSYATWLRMVGTNPRDRQSLMRHSRFTTTAEIYEQDLPESQLRAVEKLSTLVQ